MAHEPSKASQAQQEADRGDPGAEPAPGAAEGRGGPHEAAERLSPMESFREAAIELRRPFTAEAIKWKVQSNFGEKGCLVVGYIDARLVIERLNLLLPHLWYDRYTPLDQNWLRCDLTVDGITRSDVGFGAGKTGYSDALKRAGVKFGVGVSLYAIPRAELWRDNHGSYLNFRKYKNKKGEEVVEFKLTAAGDEALRERYSKWLEEVGIPLFGQPINHGDVVGSVGDADLSPAPDVEPGEGDEGAVAQLLEG